MSTYSLAQLTTQNTAIATARLAATTARNASNAANATLTAAEGVYQAMLEQNGLDVINGEPPAA